jgi:major intracellular serine protease
MDLSKLRGKAYRHVDYHRVVAITTDAARVSEHRDWAINHMGMQHFKGFRGAGQRVGVIDTGCDINHQDLKDQCTAANFISGNNEKPAWRDTCGHGTFCAGEIVAKEDSKGVVGIAPGATAFCGRVLYGDDRDGRRRDIDTSIAMAIDECVKQGCGVISMSLGGPGDDRSIREALERAVAAGVIPVAAAGNERMEGSPYASYPASYPTVISVAAANQHDLPMWFSTMGKGGKAVNQPEVAVASLEYYWGCMPGQTTYGTMIGTSQATPMIAGVALLWREARMKAVETKKIAFPSGINVLKEFREWLHRVANDTNKNGWDPELGYGVLLIEPNEVP